MTDNQGHPIVEAIHGHVQQVLKEALAEGGELHDLLKRLVQEEIDNGLLKRVRVAKMVPPAPEKQSEG